MKTYRNWRPVIGSLLHKLQSAGFTLISADGQRLEGTDRQRRQAAKTVICAVDACHLYVEDSEGISKWIFIVLGNEPEETVNDYSCHPGLDAVVDNFINQWAGKPCPNY